MKVEFWLDPFCPYSYLAHSQLQYCLKKTNKTAELDYKFLRTKDDYFDQTDAEQPTFLHWFAKTNGQEKVWADLKFEQFNLLAQELNIQLNPEDIKPLQVDNIEALVAKAAVCGQASAFMDKLFVAMFVENQVIDQSFAESLLESILSSSPQTSPSEADINSHLSQEHALISELGIEQAPLMIINEEIGLEGIQPQEHLVEVLNMVDSV